MAGRTLFALLVLTAAAVAPAFAAPPAATGAAPDVIAPVDLPSFHAVIRSDATPARVAAADAPAPMPDADAAAPAAELDGAAQVSPALFNSKTQYRGDGFAYGSTAQDVEERQVTPATGIRVKVPLN